MVWASPFTVTVAKWKLVSLRQLPCLGSVTLSQWEITDCSRGQSPLLSLTLGFDCRAGLGVPVPVGSCRLLAPQAAQGSVLPLPQFWSQPFLQGARVPFWGAASGNRGLGATRASLLPVSSSLGPPVAEPGSGFQSPSPHATGVPVSLQRCL